MSEYLDAVTRQYVARCGARVWRSTAQTITKGVSAPIVFDSIAYNDVGMWNVGSPTKLVIPIAGYYLLAGALKWTPTNLDATTASQTILLNGATVLAVAIPSLFGVAPASAPTQTATTVHYLSTNDYVELWAFHNSSVDVDVATVGQGAYPSLAAHRLP